MTTHTEELNHWFGRQLIDQNGDKIGEITDIYTDDRTGRPEWMAVKTGLFGTRVTFVPLAGASSRGEDVQVPYEKSHVKDAPNVETDNGHLTEEEEAQLYRHYGLDYDVRAESDVGQGQRGSTDDAMTRSEEELRIGKVSHEAGRVRLRKWVDTEHVSERVPVTREEAHIEREPITAENVDEATSGPEFSEAEHEEVLHEERVVTDKQAVPKERIRVEKEHVTDEQQVEEDLRKERVEGTGDVRKPDRDRF